MFEHLFRPRSLVVAGASPNRLNPGRDFIDRQRDFGYRGDIYVVREDGREIPGATVVRSWDDVPAPVDYGFVAVRAEHVAEVIDSWSGRVRFVQVFSSGFSELGDAGAALEQRIVERARSGDTRIVGPNSWGIYSPAGGLTFGGPLSDRPGGLAVVSQSGAIAVEIVMRVARTGGRFWGAVAIGNAGDVTADELIGWLAGRDDVGAVGLYCEGTADGRHLLDAFARCRDAGKPVVVLKGGTTAQGAAAASSHTGALAGDGRVWLGVCEQYDAVLCHTIGDFTASLAGFDWSERYAPDVAGDESAYAVVGPGGGVGVLLSDGLARRGLRLATFSPSLVAELSGLGFPPGTSFANPVDLPVYALEAENGRLLRIALEQIADSGVAGTLIVHLNVTFLLTLLRNGAEKFAAIVSQLCAAVAGRRTTTRWCVILRMPDSTVARIPAAAAADELAAAGALVVESEEAALQALQVGSRRRRPVLR